MRALLFSLAGLALVGCVTSNAQICDDGSICPRGFTCDVDNQRCLAPGAEAACAGLNDGDACDLDGVDGTCRLGACEPNVCGDGVRQGPEACDGDQFAIDPQRGVAFDCRSFSAYNAEGLACYPKEDPRGCTLDISGCFDQPRCGDNIVNGPEVCDGNTTSTCLGLGFDAGSVICGASCNFSILNCSRFGFTPESISDVVALAVGATSHADQWAVGLNGKMAHFDGVFWNPVPAIDRPTNQNLTDIWSIAVDDVWAIGEASTVIHYDGTAWSIVIGVPPGDYIDVWAASATEVYIAAADSKVHKFDGTSWSTLPAVPGTPFSMRGTNDPDDTTDVTELWVATEEGPLQHFDDATQLWTVNQSPPNMVTKFTDPNTPGDVWAMGHKVGDPGHGMIGHFDGTNWTITERPGEIFNNIASSAPNDAWIAGVDGLMRHFDGVAFSSSLNIGLGSGVTGISGFISLGPDEVVAVSTLRNSFRYRGQTFGQFKTLGGDPFTGPSNNAFFTFSASDAWIANSSNALHFDGTEWKVERTFASPAHSIFGFAPNDIWFGLDDGTVVHFTGGTNFITETVATTRVTQLFGSGTDIWAFATGGAFHRNAQNDWTFFPLATGAFVRSVSGTGPDDIWAVTERTINQPPGQPPVIETRLFHWNDVAWSEVPTGAVTPLLAVAAVTPTDVHVTSVDGRMLRSVDGTTFTEVQQVGTVDQLTSIVSTAPDDVIASSKRDAFHFDGRVWSPLRLPDDVNKPGFPQVIALRATPSRVDMLMERQKIMTLIRTRALSCRDNEQNACTDGVDNDCDGKLDSTDTFDCPP